jgi:ketopantoate hydroxymethyltransferase
MTNALSRGPLHTLTSCVDMEDSANQVSYLLQFLILPCSCIVQARQKALYVSFADTYHQARARSRATPDTLTMTGLDFNPKVHATSFASQ